MGRRAGSASTSAPTSRSPTRWRARSSTPGCTTATFIDRATTGFEAYRASVEPYTLERAERDTGVPADVIREAAHAYARADRAMICWTLGITEHHNAVDNVLALINLALLTGHVGRYGSGLNPLRGQNNVQGGGDMGAIPNKLPGFQDIESNDEARARFEAAWGATIPPKNGWHLTQMFEAMERGELRALYVIGENPAQSEADAAPHAAPARGPRPPGRAGHLPAPAPPSWPTWCCRPRPAGARPRARSPTASAACSACARRSIRPGQARDDLEIIGRDRAAAGPRLGRPTAEDGVERAAVAVADARAA